MRSLLEAAQVIAPCEPEWRQHCFHLVLRRGRPIAKEALARKRAVRLLDVAQGSESASKEVWFARGAARDAQGC